MARYSDITTLDANGTPHAGVYVTVKNDDGTLASLTADGGGAMGNPTLTDVDGSFYFNVPPGIYSMEFRNSLLESPRIIQSITLGVNGTNGEDGEDGTDGINGGIGSSAGYGGLFVTASGMDVGAGITRVKLSGNSVAGIGGADYIYDAAVNGTTVATNPRTQFLAADGRGFKLDPNQRLSVDMFGDTSTAAGALAALKAATEFFALPGLTRCSPEIRVNPAGITLSDTLEPNSQFHLVGSGSGYPTGSGVIDPNTRIIVPMDTTAVRVQCVSQGDAIVTGRANASGSTIRNVNIEQAIIASPLTRGTNLDAHGIHARGAPFIEDVTLDNIAGDGINITATNVQTDQKVYGNANGWFLKNVVVHWAGGNGLCVGRYKGAAGSADVNAGVAINLRIQNARLCGILDRSYYPNTYYSPLVNVAGDNGVWSAGVCYQLLSETDIGTVPGTDNLVWYPHRLQAAADTRWVAWDAGTTYTTTCYINSGQSNFFTPYAESQNGVSHTGGIVVGGNMEWTQFTARLKVDTSTGLITNLGIGHKRTTNGASNPAYTHIGVVEETSLGRPAAANSDVHKRAGVFYHQCDTNYVVTKYENNDGAGVPRDIFTRAGTTTAANELWAISGVGTAKTFGRSTATEAVFCIFDHAIHDPFNANNARIHGMRSAVPATFNQAIGEYYWNINPAAGLVGWSCKVAGTTTTAGTFAKDYLNERSDPTVGVGYVTGAGGAVTQATSKATGVTLAKVCGAITTDAASLAAGAAVSFTLTNSTIAATDVVEVTIKSGATAGAYIVQVDATAAGSCRISVRNMTAGALAEALVLNFAVKKAVAA